ncbi:MAG: DUF1501 domain-containing protein [Leptolyngbya sp. PLA3]|nr:MAG: DUF1501 domain-containing protein [Cyanobacteria bacterium CYA]MCE7969949.1 DUF1501 domain-containing protein [Leptolyngbya sp. PL-A3]
MDPVESYLLNVTRRQFFGRAARGIGAAALSSLLTRTALAAGGLGDPRDGALPSGLSTLGLPHFAPKAKRVIFLHMDGAPSQLDLFDYKPGLGEHFDKDLPDSIRMGQRITTMTSGQSRLPVAPSVFKFQKYANNQDGLWVSELYPHTASVADELCVIYSMHTDAINHDPGITFFQTGHQQPGRPSMGAWLSYGLGSENDSLPTFVVLISQGFGNSQALFSRLWGSGFLPSEHQGVQFRAASDPVLFLHNPKGMVRDDRRRMLDAVAALNHKEFERSADPEILTRVSQYEMAYRMQMSVPELTDLSDEPDEVFELYGPNSRTPGTFAGNCLLARRMAERGVRFIQLYQRGWDAHGNLPVEIREQCKLTDQPQAALIKDLRRRGLLDETLIVWAGEFGRTVYCQGPLSKDNYGRDHHPKAFTVWMAGGGVKPGVTWGRTDDFGYNIIENPVSVHDLHATMLHLLGIDHERLTYKFQGRRFRLTDVSGEVLRPLIL